MICPTMPRYLSIEEVLSNDLPDPETLDVIVVGHRGVKVHLYGFLHGVTGGGNKGYRAMVQRTIYTCGMPALIEKGFSRVYKGLEGELEDWAPIPLWQTFVVPGRFAINPGALGAVISIAIDEQFADTDRFAHEQKIEHLGDSPKFHLIEPFERRRVTGFPDPESYLRINLDRYFRPFAVRPPAIHIPDPRWSWMETLEPSSCIALRSVHMLEFAAVYAIERGYAELAVFVGEIHNTDMAWFAEHLITGSDETWNEQERDLLDGIRQRAAELARAAATGKRFEPGKLAFEAAFGSGVVSVLAIAAAGAIAGIAASKSIGEAISRTRGISEEDAA